MTSAAATAMETDARARRHDRPRRALVRACVEADDEEPEAERGHHGETRSGRDAPLPRARGLPREGRDARQDECDPEPLQRGRRVAFRRVDRERDDRRGRRDRGDDPHRADGEPAVERAEPDEAGDARLRPLGGARLIPGKASPATSTQRRRPASPIACETASTVMTARRRDASPPRKSPTPQQRAPPSARRAAKPGQSPTGRVAACASSWFAWYSTAASAVLAAGRS